MSTRFRKLINTISLPAIVLLAYGLVLQPGNTFTVGCLWGLTILAVSAIPLSLFSEEFHKGILQGYRRGYHAPLLLDLAAYVTLVTLTSIAAHPAMAVSWTAIGMYELCARKEAIRWKLL